MKFLFIFAVFAVLTGIAVSKSRAQSQFADPATKVPAAAKPETPFACNRLALTPEQRKRHFDELGPKLRSIRKSVRELSNGYEFEFSPDPATVQLVAEWAAGEYLCCPFFEINLRMEPEGGPLWLRLTGRKGTKEFIQADAAAWIKPS
jgi:hypothetical protein